MNERMPSGVHPRDAGDFTELANAARNGDGAAACRLADRYREGISGVSFDPRTFRYWYAISALAGDANGENNLGACFEHGLGCRQSYRRAVELYRRAAAKKLAYASSNLAYCYLRGHGVARDHSEALRLFQTAYDQGDMRALEMVESLRSP